MSELHQTLDDLEKNRTSQTENGRQQATQPTHTQETPPIWQVDVTNPSRQDETDRNEWFTNELIWRSALIFLGIVISVQATFMLAGLF